MFFADADVGPVTVSPTIADTSAALATVAQSVAPAGWGAAEGDAGACTEAESVGRGVELEPHAASARTTVAEASAEKRTIGPIHPHRGLDSLLGSNETFGSRPPPALFIPRPVRRPGTSRLEPFPPVRPRPCSRSGRSGSGVRRRCRRTA